MIRQRAFERLSPRVSCATDHTVIADQTGLSSSSQRAIPKARHAAMVVRKAKTRFLSGGVKSHGRIGKVWKRRLESRLEKAAGIIMQSIIVCG